MGVEFLIPCQIERGGFSTERLFTIELPNGSETFAGYFEHFLDDNKQRLNFATPAVGEIIQGFAKCRILQQKEDGTLIIDIPSSDSLVISSDQLVDVG